MTRIAGAVSLVVSLGVARLGAQCPNGAPPPCPAAAPRALPASNSVAVLFFTTHDTVDAYLADGLTDDITSLLGNVPSVQVKSPGTVRRVQRTAAGNVPTIARALAVRYVLDGSVRRIGQRVRVSARLVNGATTVAVWGDVFDRTQDELLALPSVIAREVATRVGGKLPSGNTSLSLLRTRSPVAYDHYLRGNFFLAFRSAESTGRALQEYLEAERLDSEFVAAMGRAAYAYAIARFLFVPLNDVPVESLAVRGLVVAARALQRDSNSSEVWMARGTLLAFANPHTFAGSTDAFDRAIALDPRNAEAHHQYAQILDYLGRQGDADRELRIALRLEPGRAVSYSDLALVHCRDTALAVAFADTAVILDPASPQPRRRRALARLIAGDVRGALEDAELANRLQPNDLVIEHALATTLARAGDTLRARTLMGHWAGRTNHWLIFAARLAVGDTTAALEGLESAPPDPGLWSQLHYPWLDALHGNARFARLLTTLRPEGAAGL